MASETGHAKNAASFETLISIIQSFGADYNPPRANLKLPALATLIANARADAMRAANNRVTAAQIALDAARIRRNEALYRDGTGLYDIAADIKTYIKSAFGTDSPHYKQIRDLKFTNPR